MLGNIIRSLFLGKYLKGFTVLRVGNCLNNFLDFLSLFFLLKFIYRYRSFLTTGL